MPHPFKEIYNALFYIFFSQTHDWGQVGIIVVTLAIACNNLNWSTALRLTERKISWSVGIVIIIVIVAVVIGIIIVILWGE